VDWGYYRQRLSSAIQKIITIPAAMQKVVNPVPRVPHPEWLWKKIREKDDKYQQRSLKDMFGPKVLPVHNQHLESELAGDVEDMVGPKVNSLGGGPRPMIHTFETNKEVRFPTAPNSESGMAIQPQPQKTTKVRTPDRNADYLAWLEHKKRKWKEIRENRKRSRQNFEQEDSGGHREGISGTFLSRKVGRQAQAGLGAFFRNREAALTHSHWQILHLAPSQRPGEFSAWVLSDGNMYKVPVQVPRVFYLNTRAPNTEEYPGARVNRVLPHGRQSFNLIEVVIDEKQFKDAGRMLAAHLADPEVEGVYETKLPLALHALLQLGCVCMVDPKARNRTIKQGWSLNDLRMKTTTECPYLIDNLPFFFLYHSSMDNRGIYALYMPAATKTLVVVVNPFNNREIAAAQLERQFQIAVRSQDQPKADNSEVSCKVEYAVNNADAGRLLQRTLNEYRDQHRGPTIAVVECPSLNSTIATVPVLSDFPCVEIACNARDSQYQALGWQPLAGRVAMQRCAASAFWLHERITLSRYAHVPLGNFNSDWLLFTADTFYARALRDHSQVLWVSSDGLPDLGGIPEDEPCFADEVQQPALTYPGAYRSISIELKVHHLAVNALLKSSQVNEMEGGALLGFSSDVQDAAGAVGVQTSWDETVSCAPAFQVLKHMVQGWLSDAVSSGNVFADCLLQHLYRWLCSPLSKLHDPALHRILHKVMQKVYALLLAELRKLGATIVFADFSRIIIATGKFQVPAAQGYCEYLLKTIKTRELFEWIDLEPKIYWHSLLFMDQYNYGGVQAKDILPLDAAETADSSQDATRNGSTEIVSNWNIAEYLPKATLDYFLVIVSEFVYIPWKHSQEQAIQRAEALAAGSNFCTPSVTVSAASDIEAQETAYLKHQIASYFTDKLLRIVRDLQKHMLSRRIDVDDPELQLAREFPKLAGSHLVMGDVALEFIKHVCAVLALDNRVQHNVLIMRKNLLKLVHVREFSAEAEFKDPCLSFTLPNVICSYCNDRRDLDLCRDAALLEHDWRCVIPQCGQPYDRSWIENTLLQIVRQRERLFHLQDLVCSKCCQVKASHLAEQCSCAGAFKCTDNATDFLERMRVFLNIAIYHGFNLLQEVVSWVLELSLPNCS